MNARPHVLTSLSIAILLTVLPTSSGWARSLPTEETVVILRSPIALSALSQQLSSTSLIPVSFDHALPGRGGFIFGQIGLKEGIEIYQKVFVDLYPELIEPFVFSFRVKGNLDSDDLVEMGFSPFAAEVVAPGQPVALMPPADINTPVNPAMPISSAGPATEGDEGGVQAVADKPWVPESGSVIGEYLDGAELPRKIFQSVSWEDEPNVAAFTTDVYEHNLQLINRSITDLNPVAFGSRPLCAPGQGSDFWASNDGAVWGTTFPAEAGVYTDVVLSDDCFVMDFTVGLFHPTELDAGQSYSILVRADGSAEHDYSNFELRSEKLSNDCGLEIRFGVGLIGAIPIEATANDRIKEVLIPESAGCTLPGSYSWSSGSSVDPPCEPFPAQTDCTKTSATKRISVSGMGRELSEGAQSDTGRTPSQETGHWWHLGPDPLSM